MTKQTGFSQALNGQQSGFQAVENSPGLRDL